MSPTPTVDENLIQLRVEGGVVVTTISEGTFAEEKRVLGALEHLGEVIDARQNVFMVLDMANVEYLSSAGLGRLVALLKKAMGGGGGLHLAGLRPEIRELFDVMRLDQIFEIFEDVDASVNAFNV